jgi:hypothetical protein
MTATILEGLVAWTLLALAFGLALGPRLRDRTDHNP